MTTSAAPVARDLRRRWRPPHPSPISIMPSNPPEKFGSTRSPSPTPFLPYNPLLLCLSISSFLSIDRCEWMARVLLLSSGDRRRIPLHLPVSPFSRFLYCSLFVDTLPCPLHPNCWGSEIFDGLDGARKSRPLR